MSILKALIKKEFYQIIRDPSSIIIVFVLPIILIFLFAFGISLDSSKINVGLITEDNSVAARNLEGEIKSNKYYTVIQSNDFKILEKLMQAGTIRGIIKIPQDFSKDLNQKSSRVSISTVADGSETNIANPVKNYSRAIFSNWSQQYFRGKSKQKTGNIQISQQYWYNQGQKSRWFILPGSFAISMTLVGTLLTSLVIAREWEKGTIELLSTTRIKKFQFLLSKYIPYLILGIISIAFSALVCIFFFNIPFRGSFILFIINSAFFLSTALGQGLLISTITKDQFLASQMALVTGFLPALMLGGLLFPISSMPPAIRIVASIVPARYFSTCVVNNFLAGTIWEILIPNSLFLLLIGIILFAIIYFATPERLE